MNPSLRRKLLFCQSVRVRQKVEQSGLGVVGKDRTFLGRFEAVGCHIVERPASFHRPAVEKNLSFLDRVERANAELTVLGPNAHRKLLHFAALHAAQECQRGFTMEVA